jgi:hypothetical protein
MIDLEALNELLSESPEYVKVSKRSEEDRVWFYIFDKHIGTFIRTENAMEGQVAYITKVSEKHGALILHLSADAFGQADPSAPGSQQPWANLEIQTNYESAKREFEYFLGFPQIENQGAILKKQLEDAEKIRVKLEREEEYNKKDANREKNTEDWGSWG